MSPGHPFAREGEHNIAVLEFGRHCDQKEISHPKEGHPKDPEEKDVSSKRKTRSQRESGGDFEFLHGYDIVR
jgi:hypothetical protein